jgi:putative nucleotide binding protein
MSDDERDEGTSTGPTAVVLDYLAHGKSGDDRPRYEKESIAYLLDEESFTLYEAILEEDASVSIGDRFPLHDSEDRFSRISEVDYEELSGGASSELEYVVEDLVTENEQRFVDFFNEAQPITLRLHQLNLLPGIGKKLRNTILDERKRKPFERFEDLEDRVDGFHNPEDVLVERIMEEIREEDLKYRTFAREED